MSIRNTTKNIKSIFREIEAVKAGLADELRKIDADDTRSGSYKAQQREQARSNAAQLLEAILTRAESNIAELRKDAASAVNFDYTNPKLAAAINLIKSAGKTLPEAAAEQIINDFRHKPAEMKYIVSLLDKNGMSMYAADAQQAADAAMTNASFPDRLDDILYYSTTGDPAADIDFSGIESEMDSLYTAAIEQETAESEAE